MRIYIDNILVQYPQDNLGQPTFTLRKKDEFGNTALSFTGNLTFVGVDYDYIKSVLIDSPNAIINSVVLKFVDDCCSDKEYIFKIIAESLKWCEGSCELDAAAIEKSTESDQAACIKNTLIWDNWNGFQQDYHPRFSYCNELRPSWMHDVLIIVTILFGLVMLVLSPILLAIAIIVVIINIIINFINNIGGSLSPIDFDNDPNTGIFQEMLTYADLLLKFTIGCGRKHPSPLIRNYAKNVCGKCGVTFSSSIFTDANSAYYNACWHEAPVDKGTRPDDNVTYWIDRNKPLLNGTGFFDKLKKVFNAEWVIRNNVLYFERRDYFVNIIPWVDLTTMDEDDYKICWNWSAKTRYSYGSFYYQKDAINSIGNEAANRWGDIVEWNNPYSELQKGGFEPLIEFATCRFRDDGIDRDVLSNYKYAPFVGPIIREHDRSILLNQHLSYTPMILIWDVASGVQNAKVSGSNAYFNGIPNNAQHNQNVGWFVGLNQFYNYPMWFKEGFAGNLYTNFWFIDNPKATQFQFYDFTAEIGMTCERLNAVDLYGMIKTSKGTAPIREITLNFASQKIIITGSI